MTSVDAKVHDAFNDRALFLHFAERCRSSGFPNIAMLWIGRYINSGVEFPKAYLIEFEKSALFYGAKTASDFAKNNTNDPHVALIWQSRRIH